MVDSPHTGSYGSGDPQSACYYNPPTAGSTNVKRTSWAWVSTDCNVSPSPAPAPSPSPSPSPASSYGTAAPTLGPSSCFVANCQTCVLGSTVSCATCNANFSQTYVLSAAMGTYTTECAPSSCSIGQAGVTQCMACYPANPASCMTCSTGYTLQLAGANFVCVAGYCGVSNCTACDLPSVDSCRVVRVAHWHLALCQTSDL